MILNVIWLLTPFRLILQAIPTAIWFFLTLFVNGTGFWCGKRGPIDTRSYTSFLMSINYMIMDHIGQLAKLVNFLHLAQLLELLFSNIVTIGLGLLEGSMELLSHGFDKKKKKRLLSYSCSSIWGQIEALMGVLFGLLTRSHNLINIWIVTMYLRP